MAKKKEQTQKQKLTAAQQQVADEVELILGLLQKRQQHTPIQTLVQQHGIPASYLTRHVTRVPMHFLTGHAEELSKAAKHMGMHIEDLVIVAIRDYMKRQRLQPVPFEGSKGTQRFEDTVRAELFTSLTALACEYEE